MTTLMTFLGFFLGTLTVGFSSAALYQDPTTLSFITLFVGIGVVIWNGITYAVHDRRA